MKRIWLMLAVIVLLSSITIADIIRFGGANRNTDINYVEIFSVITRHINSPNFGENITIRWSITDDQDSVAWANLTLTDANGTIAIFRENGTLNTNETGLWNSTSLFTINESGTWTYEILGNDNETTNLTYANWTGTFSITDNLYSSIDEITNVLGLWQNDSFDIEFYTDSREKLNFTFGVKAEEAFERNLTWAFNVTSILINSTRYMHYLQFNISSNSSSSYGSHIANLSIYRAEPLGRNWTILINTTISDSYGDIQFVNPEPYTFISCGGLVAHTANVKNAGNYQLTDCHPYLFNEFGAEVSTSTNFNLDVGENRSIKVYYQYDGVNNIVTHIAVRCIATPEGLFDVTTNNPEVIFTPSSVCGGGGGGGGSPYIAPPAKKEEAASPEGPYCGDGVCDSLEADENPLSCPQDCQILSFDDIFCLPLFNCGNWKQAWFTNTMVLVVIGGMIYFSLAKVRRPI